MKRPSEPDAPAMPSLLVFALAVLVFGSPLRRLWLAEGAPGYLPFIVWLGVVGVAVSTSTENHLGAVEHTPEPLQTSFPWRPYALLARYRAGGLEGLKIQRAPSKPGERFANPVEKYFPASCWIAQRAQASRNW